MKQGFHHLILQSLIKPIFTILIFLLPLALFVGCSAETHDKNPDTVQVQIPWYSNGTYSLQNVTLKTIKNMVTLQGEAARFLMEPGTAKGQLIGTQPKIRTMRTNDGTYIPEDYLSSQLLTLYAHFEKLADLDKELGVDKNIAHWPRQQTVAVDVQEKESTGQVGSDNAMYTGEYDAYLFLPYTLSDLPFSVNAGVIAHEHFHSLFFQTFIKPSGSVYPFSEANIHPVTKILQAMGLPVLLRTESQNSLTSVTVAPAKDAGATATALVRDQYHAYVLRALNEGLADVWGWIYSGDDNFVQRSAAEYTTRNLNYVWTDFFLSTNQLQKLAAKTQQSSNSMNFDASVYQIGTIYANRLWQAVQNQVTTHGVSENAARKKLAQGIFRAVGKFQKEFIASKSTEYLNPVRPLQLIQDELPELKINTNVTQ